MVVDRHTAIFGVTRKILPVVQSVRYGIATLAFRQDFRDNFIDSLRGSGRGSYVAGRSGECTDLAFRLCPVFHPALAFNPIELFEEPERLLRRTAAFLLRLEGIDEAPPRRGHASSMGCPFQCAPGGVAITHHYISVIAEEGLRVYLAAASLKIEQHDRLVNVLAAPGSPVQT